MKNIFKYSVAVIILIITACGNKNGYKIEGTIKNGNGTKVYLEDVMQAAAITIDTATVSGDKFSLHNNASTGIYRLRFGNDINNAPFVFIDKDSKIKVEIDLKQSENYKLSGNKETVDMMELIHTSNKNFAAIDTALSKLKSASIKQTDSFSVIFKNAKAVQVKFIKDFIDKQKNDEIACFALNLFGPMLDEEVPYLVDMTEKLHLAQPDSRQITGWYKQMQDYKTSLMKQQENGLPVNTQAPNIVLQNPKGDTIQLKNLQGKYVLLDFWASWCQPCRMENPNVVRMYEKYHFQGLEIFSVSLDDKKDRWMNAIKQDDLSWENHGCDFAGWQSNTAKMYKVESIPMSFLLDKKGKIIAKNLRGEQLDQKLAEIFATAAK
ncbi:MAG: TlpA disulfide reductase family protein [Chitinophagales bacterium]